MPHRKIDEAEWLRVEHLLQQGCSVHEIARRTGVSANTIYRYKNGGPTSGREIRKIAADLRMPVIRAMGSLSPEAYKALGDFSYWRQRYLGRVVTPWQEMAVYKLVELLESEGEEYLVLNCPPGSGKSTLLTDFCLWVLCRDRTTRILYGSAAQSVATDYTRRIQNALERTELNLAPSKHKERGLAQDAQATLVGDYGRFKPTNTDLWRKEKFVIAQANGQKTQEKEASVAAFGMDSTFLGGRYDLNVWDDLVTGKTLRTVEAREKLIEFWEQYAETRVEPGGLVALVGQRLSGEDLYRHALDMLGGDDWTELEDHIGGDPDEQRPMKYHHIVFKAHDTDKCAGNQPGNPDHARTALAWPDGCLLDPKRLSWQKIGPLAANKHDMFEVVYQQKDTDPANALVKQEWIEGGVGANGVHYLGCKDKNRGIAELPDTGLAGRCYSYVTVDPSPSRFWAIGWWLYHEPTKQRFLMDLVRQKMTAPEFIDWHHASQSFVGLMPAWAQRARQVGHPITHLIFEVNAAQKFMLQNDAVTRWSSHDRVRLVPHSTGLNKLDPDYGVQMLASIYEFGLVRLPWKDKPAQHASMKLIHEVTRYPDVGTTDCLMSQWFGEFQLPKLFRGNPTSYNLRGGVNDYLASKARRGLR